VLLKKNTPVFQSAVAASANKHRCFTLQASSPSLGSQELNIELDSPEQVSAWLFGIHGLVTKNGRGGAIVEEPGANGAGGRAKRFSIISTSGGPGGVSAAALPQGHALKAALAGNSEEALRAMEGGAEWQSWEASAEGKVVARTVLLFYAADETRLGSLYWQPAGTKKVLSPQRRLPLHEIRDLYTNKQTKLFRSPACQSAVTEHCFSVASANTVLNLEASSKAQLTTWLFGINRLLSRGGKKIVLEAGQAPSAKPAAGGSAPLGQKRFSVIAGAGGLVDVDGAAAARANPAVAGRLLPNEDLPLLSAGHVFMCYIQRAGVVERVAQFVFLSTDNSRGGVGPRICWCAPGFRVESELNRISLKALTDVFVGKETEVMKSPAAAQADPKCCLSLVSRHGTFNFQLDSPALLKAWVRELTSVLQRDGRKVADEAAEAAAASAAQTAGSSASTLGSSSSSRASGRRLSVMPTAIGGLPKTAHETAVAMNVKRRQSLLHLSTTDTVRMLQDGRRFTRYFDGMRGGVVQKELVTVFYARDTNSFYWAAPGERTQTDANSLNLGQLTDVYLVRQKKHAGFESVGTVFLWFVVC
jgi:hypothetical protein